MTSDPYPVAGKIYDLDETAENGVTVDIINSRTNEKLTKTTNELGEFIADLNNFTSGYSDGDIVLINAYKSGAPFKLASYTFEISGDGFNKDLYLKAVYYKRVRTEDLKQIQLNQYSDINQSIKSKEPTPSRINLNYDSDGNVTDIITYLDGNKLKKTLSYDSDGNITQVESVI